MQVRKNIPAFVMGIILLLNIHIYAAGEEVQSKRAEEAAAVLEGLGVMTDGGVNLQSEVSRREATVYICNILGMGEQAKENMVTLFNDVSPDDSASGSIKLASDLGLINGFGNGEFSPDAPVSYEQAIKIIVCALGYAPYAQSKGGYPSGYLIAAREKGITAGIKSAPETNISKETFVQMLYNSLDVNLVIQTGFGDNIDYTITTGKTLLTENLKTDRLRGVITANQYTMLNGESKLNDGEIMVNGVVYKSGGEAKNQIGYYVDFYAKKDTETDDNHILYIKPSENNKVIEAYADNISEETDTKQFLYWENKDRDRAAKRANISTRANAIYNGKAADYTSRDLKPGDGKVVLIDNNSDNLYDVIIITEYTNYIVDSVNITDSVIYPKYGKPNLTLEETADVEVHIWKDGYEGYEIRINNLKKWDVLSVAASKDNKLYTIYISGIGSITGMVNELTDDEIVIGDEELELARSFKNDKNMKKPSVGEEGIFYLDFEGRVTAYERSDTSFKTGYLLNAFAADDLSENSNFRILHTNGTWTEYKGAVRIELDGKPKKGKEILQDPLWNNEGKFKHQLITYKLNANEEINVINTVQESGNDVLQTAYALDPDGSPMKKLQYKSTARKFDQYNVNSDTLIFDLPSEESMNDENAFSTTLLSNFVTNSSYNVALYYKSDSSRAKQLIDVIVYYKETGGISINDRNRVAVVDKVTNAVNDEGEPLQRLYVLFNGKEEIYTSKNNRIINGLKKGDVIQFQEINRVLTVYRKLFSSELKQTMFNIGENFNEEKALDFWYITDNLDNSSNMISRAQILSTDTYKFLDSREQAYFILYGKVINYDGGYVTIEKSDDSEFVRAFNFASTNVYEYNSESKKVTIKKKEDIAAGTMIMLKTNDRAAIDALIVK